MASVLVLGLSAMTDTREAIGGVSEPDSGPPSVPAGLVEITTWSGRKKHYAIYEELNDESASWDALCSTWPGWARGTDQAGMDSDRDPGLHGGLHDMQGLRQGAPAVSER